MDDKQIQQITNIFSLFQFDKVFLLILSFSFLFLLVRLIQNWSGKLHSIFPSKKLLFLQLTTILSFFLYIVGTLVLSYGILKPPKELMLAVGGSLAVAIGFSLKDLVGSFIAGVIILFDRPFQVGDRVHFSGTYGDVVSIGLRAVRVQTLDDNLVTIPNNRFFTDLVSSGNSGSLHMMVVTNFHLSLDSDFEKASELLYEVAVTSPFVYMDMPVDVVVEEVEIAHRLAIRLSVKAYVFDVTYEKAFQSNITKRGIRYLRTANIPRPTV